MHVWDISYLPSSTHVLKGLTSLKNVLVFVEYEYQYIMHHKRFDVPTLRVNMYEENWTDQFAAIASQIDKENTAVFIDRSRFKWLFPMHEAMEQVD
jgi:hypothetical protein